jgi:predicted aspartyl protease
MTYLYIECRLQSASKVKYFNAFIDTGFDGDLLISDIVAESMSLTPDPKRVSKAILGDGRSVISRISRLNFSLVKQFDNIDFNIECVVMPQGIDCIIGSKLLEKIARATKNNFKIDYQSNTVYFIKMD